MTDPLAIAIDRLASVLERLEQKLDAQSPETGDKRDAAKLLGISTKTLERRLNGDMPQAYIPWQENVHWWREGDRLVFDLVLLRDWQRNKTQPATHQRAIEVRRKELLSQRKK